LDFTVPLGIIEPPTGELDQGSSSTLLSREQKKLGIALEKNISGRERGNTKKGFKRELGQIRSR
jgi:hypothetical protein